MMKLTTQLFLLFLLPSALAAQLHEPVLTGLSGQALLDALVTNYKPAVVLDYSNARDTMYAKIDNVNDTVTCVYSGYQKYLPPGTDPSTFLYMGGDTSGISAEHTFPQSMGAETGNAKSDLHHLFPVRAKVNSIRNNDPYGEIADNSVNKWLYKDKVLTTKPELNLDDYSESINATIFEPREDHKGNAARAVMYFYTMYKAEADLANPTFFASQIEDLCEWHLQDPVDVKEWERSYYIAQYQDNKPNPFVLDCTVAYRTYCSSHTACSPASNIQSLAQWGVESLSVYPNPSDKQTTIRYHLHRPLQVQLSICDALGREVFLLSNALLQQGEHQYQWDTQTAAAGLYWYKLQLQEGATSQTITGKIIVSH